MWVIEYEILANENSADEQNPCAIIIIIAPVTPQLVRVRAPAINKPMCPTDE